MPSSVTAEIHQLSQRRQYLWSEEPGTCGPEVDRLTDRLRNLYEEKRSELTQSTSRSRGSILSGARIASELERLMTERRKS